MEIQEKFYIFLCILFSVLAVTGNLIYQKFVYLPINYVHTFELSAGAILYPFTFLITDLISEFFGRERAKFCVKIAIIMNITVAMIIIAANDLDSTPWSNVDNYEFNEVFGNYETAFIGSVVAGYLSQRLDILMYLWLRSLTGGRFLWLRSMISTTASLLIDSLIVISFMIFVGILPYTEFISLLLNSYSFKLFFALTSTPILYLLIYSTRRFFEKLNLKIQGYPEIEHIKSVK